MFALLTTLVLLPTTGIDADAAKPYDLQIILRVTPHRLLTSTFRRELAADLRDSMQAALGSLGHVEIVDANAKPDAWQALDTLESQTQLHPGKRHFVQIEFADGQYLVTARHQDGSTGQASPRIRQAKTSDRAFVGRLALRFLDLDFGLVGTVVAKDENMVRLQLRAATAAGADMARWIAPGAVFSLTRIEGEPRRGRAIPWTYLQVLREPVNGVCECQLVSRISGNPPRHDSRPAAASARRCERPTAAKLPRLRQPVRLPTD
jgi:hypothetical protein